ncbi:DUF2029 domain-containing protein [Citricoccus sp. SGAir0253]|nr:DUF2029 domain-containing protein [Citricoccus sp. SGAir0253]
MDGLLGGPVGRHTVPGRTGGSFWTPMRVLILLTTLSAVVAVLLKTPCRLDGWTHPAVYYAGCYSDWAALYGGRGLAEDPFAPFAPGASFEYPVLMSVVASLAAVASRLLPWSGADPTLAYWDVNFLATAVLWVLTVVVTARSSGRRPWDAAMVAVAPGIILAGSVNWDLWAVALLAVALWLFGGRRPLLAGVFLGLGAAMKLYPVLALGALLVLAVRTRRWTPFLWTLLGTVAAWLAVNLPMMLTNLPAWSVFYTFSGERGPGLSSVWHAWNVTMARIGGPQVDAEGLSVLAFGSFFVACCGIFLLGVACRYRPRVAHLAFLVVAAFVLCNKVYSPQFVVWLVPLAVLAVPRWRDFLAWQFFEVLHFWAIWMYLAKGSSGSEVQHSMDDTFYVLAVLGHMVATAYLMGRVVEQVLDPRQDPVRASLPGGRIWEWAASAALRGADRPRRAAGDASGSSAGEAAGGTGRAAAAVRLAHLGLDPAAADRLPVDDPLGGPYDDAPDRAPWLVARHRGAARLPVR